MASPSSQATPYRGRLLTAAAAILWVLVLFAYLRHPLGQLLTQMISDDALFYLVIARNAVAGRFSSFDGLGLTNGYHPLWWLVLQPLAFLFRGPGQLERAGMGLGLLCYAGAAVILHRSLRRLGDSVPDVTVAALVLFVLPASWLLSEAPLGILMFALFLARFLDAETTGESRALGLGALGALTVLARLDAVFLVVPLLLVKAWDDVRGAREAGTLRRSARPLAIVGATVLAYMAASVVVFGHPMPISGALKSSFPRPVLPTFGGLSRYVRGLPPLGAALLWLGARGAGWRPTLPRTVERGITAMLVGSVLFYVYELLFQKDLSWGVTSWHFALATVLMAVQIGVVSVRIPARAVLTAAALMLALGAADLYRKLRADAPVDTSHGPLAEVGRWIAANTHPSAVIAATDPGLVAWLGGRHTISLDGLVNSYAYQEALRDGKLADYLEANGVDYITTLGITLVPGTEVTKLPLPARLHWPKGDTLALWSADTVFTATGGGVRVWRYRPPGVRAP